MSLVTEVEQRVQQFLGRLELRQVAGTGQQRERRRRDGGGVGLSALSAAQLNQLGELLDAALGRDQTAW